MNLDIGGQKKRRDMGGKWKIVDISRGSDYPCNLNNEKLPFDDNSVDNIFCSHTLEHLELDSIPRALKEMYRVLKKKGRIRIVVPDAEKAVKWYLNKPKMLELGSMPTIYPSVPKTRMGYLSCWFSTPGKGHNIGYDFELLSVYIRNAGFRDIQKMSFNKCSKIFTGKDYERYIDNSIFVEATK